jgi:hypothetical protein
MYQLATSQPQQQPSYVVRDELPKTMFHTDYISHLPIQESRGVDYLPRWSISMKPTLSILVCLFTHCRPFLLAPPYLVSQKSPLNAHTITAPWIGVGIIIQISIARV